MLGLPFLRACWAAALEGAVKGSRVHGGRWDKMVLVGLESDHCAQ